MATRIEHFDPWLMRYRSAGLLVLTGPAGCGKSLMLKEWLTCYLRNTNLPPALRPYASLDDEQPAPPFVAHLFTATRQETPTQCARRLIEELGSHSDERSANDLWSEAASKLKLYQIHLLIIDQAERLSLLQCQMIYDYIIEKRVCSVLLVGTPALLTTMHRDPCLLHHVESRQTIDQLDQPSDEIDVQAPS